MKHTLLSIVALITLAIVFYPQKELISKINGSPGGKLVPQQMGEVVFNVMMILHLIVE